MAKTIKLAPWPGTLVFTTKREEWNRLYVKRNGANVERYQASAGLAWDDEGYHLVGVFDGELSTLAHEMGHASCDILNHARTGNYTEGHNQEQFCYLLGHLVKQAYPILIKGDKHEK